MPLSKYGIQLYQHQKDVLAEDKKKSLLPHGCGCGKTITLCALAKKDNPLNEKICIISIKSDIEKWKEIVEKFEINADCYTKEQFKKATTGFTIKKAYDPKQDKKVEVKKTVVKPEQLRKYNHLIVDEAHFHSGVTSMMHKSLMAYIRFHNPEFIRLATGTPYSSTPWSLYALGNLLGFDWNYARFRTHFFQFIRKFGPRGVWLPKKEIDGRPIEVEIARYINFLGKAVKIEDCTDMPPRVYQTEYFDLTAEQKKAIKELDEELVLTRNLRWHQICGGTLKTEDDEIQYFKSNKLNRIVELCQENPKIFIVCNYKAEIKAIQAILSEKKVKKPIYTFTGENSSQRKEFSEKADRETECVVIANAACSAAYEVPSIPLMVFYSMNYSLVNHEQIIDRIRRLSNPAPRTYLYLICKKSIDEGLYSAISSKKNFQFEIYNK